MRILDTKRPGVLRLAFNGDGGLLLATTADQALTVWDWVAGQEVFRLERASLDMQAALSADGQWLACFAPEFRIHRTDRVSPIFTPTKGELGSGELAGGVAFTPDSKSLVATQSVRPFEQYVTGRLIRWSAGTWQLQAGFAIWPPFDRIAFDRSGQHLAGINPVRFELRYPVSGGLNGWAVPGGNLRSRHMHLAFAPTGEYVAFGWYCELHIMATGPGKVVRVLSSARQPYRDAAFTADGGRLATAHDDGTIAFHDTATWAITQRFDWNSGPIRSLAFSPDGACGICGTADGKLIIFDVD